MEVVIRPVNDEFLTEVVFPAFELGMVEAAPGIEHIIANVADPHTRMELELVMEHSDHGSFFALHDDRWTKTLYRLLFHDWRRGENGWGISNQYAAFAGPWEESFHLALMLDDPDYPYAEDASADLYRRAFWGQPKKRLGLPTLLCGAWDPLPPFPPDQVLTTEGNGLYNPKAGIARADWSWRPMLTVSSWAARMPSALNALLEREIRRLKPVSAPEKHEVLDYWLGRTPEPPLLAVAFSGLGPRAHEFIREIGAMAHLIRNAATAQQGLTAVISRRSSTLDNFVDER